MPTPLQTSGHKNSYRRKELTVAKRLKWLMLSEFSYEKISMEKNATSSQKEENDPTSRKYEMVQRTTHHAKTTKGSDEGGDGEEGTDLGINSVDIMCVVHKSTKKSTDKKKMKRFLVIVSQYRPPVDAFTLEMPAGLLDESDQNPTFSAARELFEETGYIASKEFLMWREAEEKKKNQKKASNADDTKDASECASQEDGTITKYGPLSYDPGLTDGLFDLVRFDIHVNEDETTKGTNDISARMHAINQNPLPHLDEGEDAVTHLLQLDSDSDDDVPLEKVKSGGVLSRLEQLRRSVNHRTVVDGKLQTLIVGMAFSKQ